VLAGSIGAGAACPTEEWVVVVGGPGMPGSICLVPLVMKLEIRGEWDHDPGFQHDRFAGHIVALSMNLQQMVPLIEIEVPPLRPRELDTAEADGTPEDGHGVVSERQFLCRLRGPASGHELEELTDLVFTQTIPDKAFGDAQAPDFVHGIPGELALVDHPATEATERGEVKVHRTRFNGVDEIGLIGAQEGDGQWISLIITTPPVEEPAQGFAIGDDGGRGAKAG